MFQHCTRNAFSTRIRMGCKAAITNMRGIAALIGADVIGAQNLPFVFCDKGGVSAIAPKCQRIRLRYIRINRIGFTRTKNQFQDRPDGRTILFFCIANNGQF